MKRYELVYEFTGHHHKEIEVPDDMSIAEINDNHWCEEYHSPDVEECLVLATNEIKENE